MRKARNRHMMTHVRDIWLVELEMADCCWAEENCWKLDFCCTLELEDCCMLELEDCWKLELEDCCMLELCWKLAADCCWIADCCWKDC